MAKKKKQPEGPKGAAPWMATFSDLMNLLLCFFVLLFSMSTVDAEKFQMVVASLQQRVSILPDSGSATIGSGNLVGGGIRMLEYLDTYYNELANNQSEEEVEEEEELKEKYKQEALEESEEMAENIENAVDDLGISGQIEVGFNEDYVMLNLSGAILFASGKAEIIEDAYPIVDKIAVVLGRYTENIIEIEGHTDNVPISSGSKYESNDVLSMYRALTVADYIREKTKLNHAYIKSSGRGEYVPIADNSTEEGRARNRRVVIKIYNSYSSNLEE
uniref:flagellar motor protein MotB n=1 Tax=Agathobacter sp. TaxID=2021311 RepID=UPI004056315E